ncbi:MULTISPECIES: TRAP transporter substrate-binding protein [unclassified Croceitalea]|uniref:TRAP transporter substrate-binding protein n=1 Tax=unclassified Croceitalea TaxID=2632280 RepID=UPI0030DDC710
MKHKLLTYKTLLLFAGLLSLLSCGQEGATKTLTFAHNLPLGHPVHKGVEAFKSHLETISEGKLTLKIYANGQLGSEREVLELLQIGSISMTKVSAAAMSNFVPKYRVLGIPYLFRNKEHLFNVLEGETGELLLEKGTASWLRGLCFYDAGSRSFYTKDKFIETPEDLNGMKIRVMSDKMSVAMVEALGGSPTPMSFGELYTALQQGVVDGAENNAPSFVTSRHFEICKYYSLDAHSYVPDVVLMGTKFLERLTEEEKEWVFSAARQSAQDQKVFWKAAEDESMDILKQSGVKFITPDKSLFANKTKGIKQGFTRDKEMQLLVDAIEKTE